MRRNILIIGCCVLLPTGLLAQGAPFRLLQTVEGNFAHMTVDKLGNLYIETADGQLQKTSHDGSLVAVFNEVRKYGKLHAIDVSNPLKSLLYYKDFGTVVVLDRFLNIRNVMDLRQSGLLQVKAIGQAYDNGYWVFDEQDARIKHLNASGAVTDQFADFRLLFDTMPSPQQIVDQNKQLYLYDSTKGVYIFDYYGTFRQRLPFTGWKDFFVMNTMLFGRDSLHLYRYDTREMREQLFPALPSMQSAIHVQITMESVYVLYPNRLETYQIVRN